MAFLKLESHFSKVNYSAFYFANLWCCFLGLFIFKDFLKLVGSSIQNFLIRDVNVSGSPTFIYYWSLLGVFLAVVIGVMILIMKPLNIHIPDNKIEFSESLITFIFIAGFFFYSFHKIMNIGMPELFPTQVVKLIMGTNAYYLESLRPIEGTSVIWSAISDPLWSFGPIGYMWWRAKTGG
jgi:hypothetical protein